MKNTIPDVDAYIDQSAEFAQPILNKLRRLFHQAQPDMRETIKWSSPFFEYKGIVGNMSTFTNHVSYGFWKAGLMSDPEGILERAGNTEMAVLKAKTLEDLPSDQVMIGYIQEAVDLNKRGVKISKKRAAKNVEELDVPEYFLSALHVNKRALVTFESFSNSNRKEYVEWVTEAKRENTRDKRLAAAVEWMAEGKPRNWKYKKEWR